MEKIPLKRSDDVDILVHVGSPDALNNTLSMLPGAGGAQVVFDGGEAIRIDGCYVVRVPHANASFVDFAMRNQGYAEVVKWANGKRILVV